MLDDISILIDQEQNKVFYTDSQWELKLASWYNKNSTIKRINNLLYNLQTISNDSIKRKICYILGCINTIGMFFNRYLQSSSLSVSVSPKLRIFDNYTLEKVGNQHVSKYMSIYNFIYGCVINNTSGIYQKVVHPRYNDLSKYIFNCQDFLVDLNGVFINYRLYKNAPIIKFYNNQVFVNDTPLLECSEPLLQKVAYQVIITQQHLSHLGYGHQVGVQIYNKIKELGITIKDDPILELVDSFGKELRDVTEGFGKTLLFNVSSNSANITPEEINIIIKNLPDPENIIYKKLSLTLKSSIQVYSIYKKVITKHTSQELIDLLQNKLVKTPDQVVNLLTNFIYCTSYHHNKSHDILKYTTKYTKHNYSFSGLLNQVYLAMETQKNPTNIVLQELKIKLNEIKDDEGDFVCNVHQYINFF